MTDRLTVADILARGVAVEWHEAVAIVRAVTEASHGSAAADRVPDLHEILLSADGTVAVTGGAPGQEPVRRLGQLLQGILNTAEPPVQLRLAISQATAPIPAYSSIRQFDEALGYFERPGRPSIIAAVYRRAVDSPARQIAVAVPTLDAIAPLPSGASAEQQPQPRPRNRRREQAAAAVTVLMLAGSSAAVSFTGSARRKAAMLPAIAGRAAATLGDSIFNGISFVTERVGLGRLVSADEGSGADAAPEHPPAPTSPKLSTQSRARPTSTTPSAAAGKTAPKPAAALAPIPSARPAALAALVPIPGNSRPFAAFDLEPAPAAASRAAVETIYVPVGRIPQRGSLEDEPTYAAGSEGVMPPVAMRPQLPRELPPNTRRSDLRQIEVIVSPTGIVESVKLVGAPRNVHDSMLLSAIKAWEFVPAVKDGVAVRYRKTITVAPWR